MMERLSCVKLVIFAGLLFLSACSASVKDENVGVQDIQPGERSVIQPPSTQPVEPGRQIEERNI